MRTFTSEYQLAVAHWNVGHGRTTPRNRLWLAIHGHTMRVAFTLVSASDTTKAFVVDELELRTLAMKLDNKFLSEHPDLANYGASQEGVAKFFMDQITRNSTIGPDVVAIAVEVDETPALRYKLEWQRAGRTPGAAWGPT